MKIETKFLGAVEIDEQQVIEFKQGIPGFEDSHRYVILKHKGESPFFLMQSIDTIELALVLIELEQVVPGYEIDLNEEDSHDLKLTKPDDSVTFAVVVIPSDAAKATVNLVAPIVVNNQARLGKQIIVDHPQYSMRYPLFAPVEEKCQPKLAIK